MPLQLNFESLCKEEELIEAVMRGLKKTALRVETEAKQNCPVDTGALRQSIQTRQTGDTTIVVSPQKNYAGYVEFGTKNMEAQPYMGPAWDKHKEGLAKDVTSEIKKVLKGAI